MNTVLLVATITLALCGLGVAAHGQTFSEWFRQKKTRMKYLRQQVAALETLSVAIRGGYEQTEEGVEEVDGEEKATVEMDRTWLRSLGQVKEVIRNSAEVRRIYQMLIYFKRKKHLP